MAESHSHCCWPSGDWSINGRSLTTRFSVCFMTTSVNDSSYLHSPYWSQPSNSLNHEHIAQALNHSSDEGATLVFSKLDLTDISVDAAEELATKVDANNKGMVKRWVCMAWILSGRLKVNSIAMGHNRLSTLPTELALLTHLRYLNLRHNSFSTFPRVVRILSKEPDLLNVNTFQVNSNPVTWYPRYQPQ